MRAQHIQEGENGGLCGFAACEAGDEGGPGGDVSLGHFVEQVRGVGEEAIFEVRVEEGVGDEEVGAEPGFEERGVEGGGEDRVPLRRGGAEELDGGGGGAIGVGRSTMMERTMKWEVKTRGENLNHGLVIG